MQKLSPASIKKIVVAALKDHLATDIVVFNVKKLSDIADYMIIATASSTTHTKSLIDKIREKLLASHVKPIGIEGAKSKEWMLLDFGSVIIHIMLDKARKFYDLEKLWGIKVSSPKTGKKKSTSTTIKKKSA